MIWTELNYEQRKKAIVMLAERGRTVRDMAVILKTTNKIIYNFCQRAGLSMKVRKRDKSQMKRVAAITSGSHYDGITTTIQPPDVEPVSFIDAISHDLCRWPLWNTFDGPNVSLCCGGERMTGRPYCTFHEDIHRGIGTPSERRAGYTLKELAGA